MSKHACPIPVITPLVDAKTKQLTDGWRMWFHRLGEDWIEENKIVSIGEANYSIHGNQVTLTYYGSPKTITLPYPTATVAIALAVDAYSNSRVIGVQQNQTSVNMPVLGTFSITYIANTGG